MSQGGMHNLTTLIKRLEAATSRLEDIASSTQGPDDKPAPGTSAAAISRSASINGDSTPSSATPKPSAAGVGPPSPSAPEQPQQVQDFDRIVKEYLRPFQDFSDGIGSTVSEAAAAFANAFKSQRKVILISTKAKKPAETAPVFMEIFQELQKGITEVNSIRDKNRKGPQENHLSSLVEGSGAFSWLLQPAKPDNYIEEVLGGAKIYSNRILTQHKDKEKIQTDWVNAFVALFNALKDYAKQHYPRGLTWNANGVSAEEALKDVQSLPAKVNGVASPRPSAPAAGGPAPPPPPPPLPPAFDITSSEPQKSASSNDMGAVFEQLNRGEAVTSGLKKVDKSQTTHKNPTLKSQPPAPPGRSDSNSSRGKSPAPSKKPESLRAKKPSKKELEGNKWTLEHYDNESTPINIQAEKQQSILISRCKSTDVIVNGKANSIIVDGCQRLNLIVQSLVSTIEVVNSARFNVQVTGTLPSIQLDKVDQSSIYLSEESVKQTVVLTSKCSAINIVVPPKGEEQDSVECPVPEQFKSFVNSKGELVTEVVKQEG